ncbi:MAG: LysM peptidoglycan-binding domain-containing protein [Chloroflexi bacterium]|nr:LysM peptidoglycan-binding domain-containing protein [Chloroflexota bacterium]
MALGLGTAILMLPRNVQARDLAQAAYQTPTPNTDGQILYTVQEGDSCTRIFLLTGVSIDDIVNLNSLTAGCEIYPGQELLLGQVDPVISTPEPPQPTADPGLPTPTPFEGHGKICVALFEDLDGNQKRSQNELYLGGGVVSVNNRTGTFSQTRETVGGDPDLVGPVCFDEVPDGEYNLSVGVPDQYNPTTSMNYSLKVTAGDTIVVDFGAQPSTQMVAVDTPAGEGRSPLLLAIGLFLLAAGAGLAFFFLRSKMNP